MKRVEDKIKELQDYSLSKWSVCPAIDLIYDINNSSTLGYFSPYEKSIHLNPSLLEQYGELYIKEVVQHEFAHAVIHEIYPLGVFGKHRIRTHGKEFQQVCSVFGIQGRAFINLFNCKQTRNHQNKTKSEIRRGL